MENQAINDYIAGAFGGTCGLIIGHPFDTTKVQLQTSQTSTPYKNTWEAIKNINNQGMSHGFFRGLAFPAVSYGVVNSVFFGTYGNTLKLIKRDGDQTHAMVLFSGMFAGVVQLSVVLPVERVKVVLQSQIPHSPADALRSKQFRGPVDCSRHLFKEGGIKAFYRGGVAMTYRDVPTYGIYMFVYEYLKERIQKSSIADKDGMVSSTLAGGLAGSSCWFCAHPADVVKSLIQADSKAQYSGTMDCIRQLYASRGVGGFFTGVGVNVFRAFPVNAVTFLIYSQTLAYLNGTNAS